MYLSVLIYILRATCFFVSANSLENVSENGWRPMSREKVAELQNFIRPINTRIPEYPDIFQQRIEAPSQIKPVEYETIIPYWNREDRRGKFFGDFTDIRESTETIFDQVAEIVDVDLDAKDNSNSKTVIRKAKKIDDNASYHNGNTVYNYQDNKEMNDITKNLQSDILYEVTENIEENKEQEQKESTTGYIYETPKIEAKEGNNLTKNLFKILANYNIRSNDYLPNYALSLRPNSRNLNNDYIYMKLPLKVPVAYNSANHLPIDPLLAVFLSNYGYYLPGLYGYQRNYNNLYGYLASNNIHNNKPFGSYKVFSDTDSNH